MVQVNSSYPDLSGGEISPKYWGRHDLQIFYKGLRRARNFITESAGGAFFRPGFYYGNGTRNNLQAWLTEFRFTDSTSFAMEFTTNAIRFYRNDGQVRFASQAISGISKANPAVVTYVGADTYVNGDRVVISGVVGMVQVNNIEFTVAGLDAVANTFQLSGINSTAYTAYGSGGIVEKIMEITTTYAAADIPQLKMAQEKNVLYIAHPNYNPKKLTYTSPTSWAFADHSPTRKSRNNAQVISAVSLANPGVVTYTGSDSFANGDTVFISSAAGMTEINDRDYTVAGLNAVANTFQLSGVDTTGYAAYTGGGIVRKVVTTAAPFLSAGEFPGAVGFYERRLYYAGSTNKPNTVYGSASGKLDDFTLQINPIETPEDDEGIEYAVFGATLIEWLRSTEKFLVIGANNDILLASGGIDDVITPSSISIRPTNSYGSADVTAIGRGSKLYYLQTDAETLRSFQYSFEQDQYVPINRNEVAPHITESGIAQFDYLEATTEILWGVRNDGKLAGMTVSATEDVSGWHLHTTAGKFKSACTLVRKGKDSQLWACVERTVNGVPRYSIEFQTDLVGYPFTEDFFTNSSAADNTRWLNMIYEAQKDSVFLDSALTYNGAALSTQTLTPAAVSGASVVFTAGGAIFDAAMIGRQLIRKSITGDEKGLAQITAFTNTTTVTCEILEAFNSTSAIPAGQWILSANTVQGVNHLEGLTVSVVADGAQHPDVVVTNGVVTLNRQAGVFHVGLSYSGEIETNELEGGGTNGVAQTKVKSLQQVGVRFLNSLYAKFGSNRYRMNQIEGRTASMRMDRPPVPFTGDGVYKYTNDISGERQAGWTRNKRIVILQDLPFPCYIQLIVPYFSVSN